MTLVMAIHRIAGFLFAERIVITPESAIGHSARGCQTSL
jgi:hypothetical protein